MKDIEKAEEIANKRCHEFLCFGHCNFSSPKHHRCGNWHREYNCALDGYNEGFKDCAKSRLNITTISDCPIKEEWHDLKKDPNDLPKPTTPVLVRLESGVPYVSWISSDKGWWFCTNYYTGEDKVIAWCEIPTFDKE